MEPGGCLAGAMVLERGGGDGGQFEDAPALGRLVVAAGTDAAVDRDGAGVQVDIGLRQGAEFLGRQAG
jgi:hypothetical protein